MNEARLICTILNLTMVSSREEGSEQASCSELINCDGLGDGLGDATEGRSK